MKLFEDFAKEIGFNRKILDTVITFSDRYYQTFYISKKNQSKKRTIDCPSKEVKYIQRWLLKKYLNDIPVSTKANGFIIGRGTKRNAQFHLNKKHLLKIDIKDFFTSISQGQVFLCLKKHFENDELATKLAKLCTYKRRLPQGAPTSPAISNIVFHPIDDEISNYCNRNLITYSRYADDMVFSSDNKNALVDALPVITTILFRNDFKVNTKKTKFLSGKGPMTITGININEGRLTISKKIKRDIRSQLYEIIANNNITINKKYTLGTIRYIKHIEPEYYKKITAYVSKLRTRQRHK